jgi:hypothetical protein
MNANQNKNNIVFIISITLVVALHTSLDDLTRRDERKRCHLHCFRGRS